MKKRNTEIEHARQQLQTSCDLSRTQLERNRMGQFATPYALASEIVAYSLKLLLREDAVHFMDPAFGTGAFYSALLHCSPERIATAVGFEIDPHYASPAAKLWRGTGLQLRVHDFTAAEPKGSERPNLLICNPPYVRHHHLSALQKLEMQRKVKTQTGITLSGLAGLYCHFILLAHAWMRPGGIAAWLVPSEFMNVNYGEAIKNYLLRKVTLIRLHRFDPADVQFDDALVSSAILWFRNTPPSPDTQVEISFGGTVNAPSRSRVVAAAELRRESKWTRLTRVATPYGVVPLKVSQSTDALHLGDLFTIKRGLATGDNKFFVLDEERIKKLQIQPTFLRPILPSPRYLTENEILADSHGIPLLDRRLFLIDCPLPLAKLQRVDRHLGDYLEQGEGTVSTGYLCRSRSPWYSQEKRPPAPFLCTYMGRTDDADRSPFRFILNHSKATAANVYLLMYPKPEIESALHQTPSLQQDIFRLLNEIPIHAVMGESRVYGGGLHKLEPRELANVPIDEMRRLLLRNGIAPPSVQMTFDDSPMMEHFPSS